MEFYRFILITHRQQHSLKEYLAFIEQCLDSGITSLQLREKNASAACLEDFAFQLKALLDRYQIPLLINDDLKFALQVNATGVHLGQTDGCPFLARQVLGQNKKIGLSLESEEDLQRANQCALDYVAASAVFPSHNKSNIRTLWGLTGLRSLAKRSQHPVIAIGGINKSNVEEVLQAGAQGIAVIGALHEAKKPAAVASSIRKLLERSFK